MNSSPLICCWSAKGGAGTSVFAAILALSLARSAKTVLVDAAGDQHAIFGDAPAEVGFVQWAAGGEFVPVDALARLAVDVAPSLKLVPSGPVSTPTVDGSLASRLREAFPAACIVVDAGMFRTPEDPFACLATAADHSFAVTRPCYLAAQRLLKCDVRRDGIVVVEEPGRVLSVKDVRDVLGTVSLTFPFDPAIARVVDAGRIARRLPRSTKSIEKFVNDLLRGEVQRAS